MADHFWVGFEKRAFIGPQKLGPLGQAFHAAKTRFGGTALGQAAAQAGQKAQQAGKTAKTFGKGAVTGAAALAAGQAVASGLKGANQGAMVPMDQQPRYY